MHRSAAKFMPAVIRRPPWRDGYLAFGVRITMACEPRDGPSRGKQPKVRPGVCYESKCPLEPDWKRCPPLDRDSVIPTLADQFVASSSRREGRFRPAAALGSSKRSAEGTAYIASVRVKVDVRLASQARNG